MGEHQGIRILRREKMGSLAVEAPRFGKGKGSGAKEDSSPASAHIIS